jgi:hypothetical protein
MPKQTLITSANLAFSKPNCGCGIVSSKQRKEFLKSNKKHSRKTKINYSRSKRKHLLKK